MEGEAEVQNQSKANSEAASNDGKNSVKMETDQVEQDFESKKKKATLLFLQGKRSIYIRDYQAALVALYESIILFSQIYPEQDDALADPYFYYGKALLEVGRSESDVLGDQVQDRDDDDDDEDDDDDNNENDNDNDNDDDDNEIGEDKEDKDNDNDDVNDGAKGGEGKTESEKNGNFSNIINKSETHVGDKSEVTQEDGKSGEEENCEVNDLQLSWEYLELAKLIYMKKADSCKDIAIKLAETYLCLGENGLESENYSVAIEDIKQALELQKKHLKDEGRRIAETYYQLGVAYSLCQNYDEAIENFKKAIEQLEKKISSLEIRKKMGDKKTEEEAKDAFYTMDGEINEIKTIIKDIEEKIKDMVESKNKVKAELIKQVYGSSSSTADNQAEPLSSQVTDISHLIKRKRKNEQDDAGEEKKLKTN